MSIAIISGASSGLGASFARAIIKLRKNVEQKDLLSKLSELWFIARNKEKLESLQKEILESQSAQNPLKCKIFALNLADLQSFSELESALKSQNAQISLLISNAGVARYGKFVDSSLQDMLDIINVNIVASSALTKICLPFMAQGSKIIEVSSVASFAPNVNLLVYSASKAYLSAFSLGLNEELKTQGIGVCALCPGLMQTGMTPDLGQTREGARKLPELDSQKVAINTIKAALKGKTLYTPSLFYKLYAILARILPRSLIIKLAKM